MSTSFLGRANLDQPLCLHFNLSRRRLPLTWLTDACHICIQPCFCLTSIPCYLPCLCRALAYEALGLFTTLLEPPADAASAEPSALEALTAAAVPGGQAASGVKIKHDFRGRAHLSALLAHIRNGLSRPLARLPNVVALWLSEASLALARGPGTPAYGLASKALLRQVCALRAGPNSQ
jgi:hypothetical protein